MARVQFSREEDDALGAAHLAFRPDAALTLIQQPGEWLRISLSRILLTAAELHNLIGRTGFCDVFDSLTDAVRLFPDADYPRSSFPSCTIRFRTPRGATMRFFCGGKMTCCGTSSPSALIFAFQKIRAKLNAAGLGPVCMRPIVYENHVYGYDVGRRLNIANIEFQDELRSVFQPETFPGLVYKIEEPSMKLLIFESGRIMLTGVRKPAYVRDGIDQVNRFLADIIARDPSAGVPEPRGPRKRGYVPTVVPRAVPGVDPAKAILGRKEVRQRGARVSRALRNIEKRWTGVRHDVSELKRLCAEEVRRIEEQDRAKQEKQEAAKAAKAALDPSPKKPRGPSVLEALDEDMPDIVTTTSTPEQRGAALAKMFMPK